MLGVRVSEVVYSDMWLLEGITGAMGHFQTLILYIDDIIHLINSREKLSLLCPLNVSIIN